MKYGKMMKGIGVAALALTVVSSCIVGGTLAKYTTTATGNGSAVVAKWAPSFKNGNNEFSDGTTVLLEDTSVDANRLKAQTIAPGTKGNFDIVVSRGDTEVAFNYSVTISDLTNCPKNLKFYSDDSYTTEITPETVDGKTIYKVIANTTMDADADPVTDIQTGHVYWQWPFEASVEASKAAWDQDDNAAGTAADADRKMTFKINCTATQVQ